MNTHTLQDAYCIDLDEKCPEVLLFKKSDLQLDLNFNDLKYPEELSDYDRKVFVTQDEAEAYLLTFQTYFEVLKKQSCYKTKDVPHMLLKRRYLVQTLMGQKTSTIRNYRKNWIPGQMFNFHDQTYFLTVELINIRQIDDDLFLYNFKTI